MTEIVGVSSLENSVFEISLCILFYFVFFSRCDVYATSTVGLDGI